MNAVAVNSEFPFILSSRRDRESMNSWMNDNRRLFEHQRGNQAEMHIEDMEALKLEEGDAVRIRSATGQIELTVTAASGGRRGVVTIPHGWGSRVFEPRQPGQYRRWGENRNRLVDNQRMDPLSQTPLLNMTRVRVEPVEQLAAVIPGSNQHQVPMAVGQ